MKRITFILLIFSSVCHSQIIDFPDNNFKNALLSHNPIIDLNGDGEIQVSEAEGVIQISISFQPITSLEGIQYFTSLEKLWYQQNFQSPAYITEIDLSNNINLKLLALGRNRLEFIDLSNNLNLERLSLNGNLLASIDLSNNINLKILDLYNKTVAKQQRNNFHFYISRFSSKLTKIPSFFAHFNQIAVVFCPFSL